MRESRREQAASGDVDLLEQRCGPTGTRSGDTGEDEQRRHGSGATELWIRFEAQMT
jgi:hypothetical protein